MNNLWSQKGVQMAVFILAFGVIPAAIYWFGIRPPLQQLLMIEQQMASRTDLAAPSLAVVPAAAGELQTLSKANQHFLGQVKQIASTGELMRFSGLLTDALAEEARLQGLHVESVELGGNPVKGRYNPSNENALHQLALWPNVAQLNTTDPMKFPNLQIPFQEWQMTVSAEYSKVFQFIDSLADFPSLISVAGLTLGSDTHAVNYHLKLRGYYWSTEVAPAKSNLQQGSPL